MLIIVFSINPNSVGLFAQDLDLQFIIIMLTKKKQNRAHFN